jgi:hypothetical protein
MYPATEESLARSLEVFAQAKAAEIVVKNSRRYISFRCYSQA